MSLSHPISNRQATSRLFSLAAALLALSVVCPPAFAAEPKPTPSSETAPRQTLILVLFDISSGTATDEIKDRYRKSFNQILDMISGGEVLMGDVITDNPLATSSLPLDIEFTAPRAARPGTNVSNVRLDRQKRNARETVETFLKEGKSSARTDLLGAFQVADKIVNGEKCKGMPRKVLVVFSDMVQESAKLNFVTDQLTSDSATKLVDAERQAGRLPNLKDVDVWVVGATAATQGGLDSERINRIQDFWLHYFAQAGARIDKGRYAATLMNFAIPKPAAK